MTKYEELATRPCLGGEHACRVESHSNLVGVPEQREWLAACEGGCGGTGYDPATAGLRGKHDFYLNNLSGKDECRVCGGLWNLTPYCIPTSEAERIGRLVLMYMERDLPISLGKARRGEEVWMYASVGIKGVYDTSLLSEALAAARLEAQAK